MDLKLRTITAIFAAVAFAAAAQTPPPPTPQHVYPAKGQSPNKQASDEAECSNWASKQTSFDPSTPPPATATAPPVTGSGARVAGAAGGAAIAGIAGGNAGTGAIVGGVAGGAARRVQSQNAVAKQNAANAQSRAAAQANWQKAREACLTGRGYTVR